MRVPISIILLPKSLPFFMGTASHNTIQLGDYDQMQKGGRFIWYHWSQAVKASLTEEEDWIVFEGTVHAYRQVHPAIFHTRTVRQHKHKPCWEIEDQLNLPDLPALQSLLKNSSGIPIPNFSKEGIRFNQRMQRVKNWSCKPKTCITRPATG